MTSGGGGQGGGGGGGGSSNLRDLDNENYWNDSKSSKGFAFGDEGDEAVEEDQGSFFGFTGGRESREVAVKVGADLRAEIISINSITSDGSNEDGSGPSSSSTTAEAQARLKDLPSFLFFGGGTSGGGGGDFELEIERPSPSSTIVGPVDFGRPSHHHHHHLPSVEETIHAFLNSQDGIPLEHFKSLAVKKQLLARAIDVQDGNAILSVTLFLFKTLKHSLFRQILVENKVAAHHYVRYLETRNETQHLVDLLNMMGRTKEAMLTRYRQILRREGNLQNLLRDLDHFHKAECQLSNEESAVFISQHLDLLQLHKSIKEKDPSFSHMAHPSVLQTLNYVANHYYENSVPPLTVEAVRVKFNLSPKQHHWVLVKALVTHQKWPQIDALLLTKTWLGGSKDKCLLPLEDVCHTIKDAPTDLISRFVRLIEDVEKRLAVARKFKCHMVVIDVFASRKDRAAILSYKSNLEEHSKESVYAEGVLKTAIKWKN